VFTKPAFQFLWRQLCGMARTECFADDRRFALVIPVVFVVCYEFEGIVDQLADRHHLGVAQLRQLAACHCICLTRLVKFDRV
jgi:hypothetical protein